MSKVLVTQAHLHDIGAAIRERAHTDIMYKPGEMAAGIRGILPRMQEKTATENGVVVTADTGYDGLSRVAVDVPLPWRMVDEALAGGYALRMTGSAPLDLSGYSAAFRKFYNSYARTKPTTYSVNQLVAAGDREKTLAEVLPAQPAVGLEYYGNTYGNAAMIADLDLVLLGDFSQGGAATGNALSDSIENYSAVLLNGVYRGDRASGYNTSMFYDAPALNTAYWTGMKDRNTSYDCYVTFTGPETVSLSGSSYRQVIIYGVK